MAQRGPREPLRLSCARTGRTHPRVETSTWYTLASGRYERFIDVRTFQTARAQSNGSRLESLGLRWSDLDIPILEAAPKCLD